MPENSSFYNSLDNIINNSSINNHDNIEENNNNIIENSNIENNDSENNEDPDFIFYSENKKIDGALGGVLAKQIPHQVKLRDMLVSWHEIVGLGLAKHSAPYDLLRRILFVSADSSAARSKIFLMRDNISKIIKRRWDLDVDNVRVTPAPIYENFNIKKINKNPVQREIVPTRDEINYFREQMSKNLTNLTPEAAEALVRLRAVFAKKFK